MKFANAAREGTGNVGTRIALVADTKSIVLYSAGDHSGQSTIALLDDPAQRHYGRIQLTTGSTGRLWHAQPRRIKLYAPKKAGNLLTCHLLLGHPRSKAWLVPGEVNDTMENCQRR